MEALRYNLQFFADDGGEKTEEPTSKKLDDARKKGQVAKSKELDNAVTLIGLFVILKVFVSYMGTGFVGVFQYIYNRFSDVLMNISQGQGSFQILTRGILTYALTRMLLLMAPFFLTGVLVAVVISVLQVKWKVSGEPLKPKFSKLNPLSGMKRIFSKDSVFELFKSVLKIGVIAVIAYTSIRKNAGLIFAVFDMQLMPAVLKVGSIVLDTGLRISFLYLVVGLLDFIYQKLKFKKDMKMTKQEVKDEYKNTEGDPQIKGRQRQRMREASQRRMMQDVPKADVVITNPTHYAVALRYDTSIAKAPVVVAKGEDFLAQKIKEIAKENQVEIVENKPLARMLYATVDVGQEIPPELYQTVAEVLAMVYQLRDSS